MDFFSGFFMSQAQQFYWRFRNFSDKQEPKLFVMMSTESLTDSGITLNREIKNQTNKIEYSSNAGEFSYFVAKSFPVGIAIFPNNGNFDNKISFSVYLNIFVKLIEKESKLINHAIDWACIPLKSDQILKINDFTYKSIDTKDLHVSNDFKTVIDIFINSILLISDYFFNKRYNNLTDVDRGRLLNICIKAYENQEILKPYSLDFNELFEIIEKNSRYESHPNPFITFLVFCINNDHRYYPSLYLLFNDFLNYCYDSESLSLAVSNISGNYSQIPLYHIIHIFTENIPMNVSQDKKVLEILKIRDASDDDVNILSNSNKDQLIERNKAILLSKLERSYCNSLDYIEKFLITAKTGPKSNFSQSQIKSLLDAKRECKIMLNQIYKFNSWDDKSLFMYDFVFPEHAHKWRIMFRGDYNIQTILQNIKEEGFTEDKNNRDNQSAPIISHM